MQCENEIHVGGPADNCIEQCRRAAFTECGYCGNDLCWGCASSCLECGHNFCEACLDDHAKEMGHQIDLPPQTLVERVLEFVRRY